MRSSNARETPAKENRLASPRGDRRKAPASIMGSHQLPTGPRPRSQAIAREFQRMTPPNSFYDELYSTNCSIRKAHLTIKENQNIGIKMARGGKRQGAGRKKGSRDRKPRSSPIIIAPAQEKRDLREAARQFTGDALKTLAGICKSGQSEAARISAACALLDRGYGKPTQQLETGSPGEFSRMTDEELEAVIAEGVELIAKANGGASRR